MSKKTAIDSLIFPNIPYNSHLDQRPSNYMSDEILTIREVAELLKINLKTAYRLVGEGKLPGFKVGGSWRFDRQEISRWIRQQVQQGRSGASDN
jgi:excisionase family DNA binding protein